MRLAIVAILSILSTASVGICLLHQNPQYFSRSDPLFHNPGPSHPSSSFPGQRPSMRSQLSRRRPLQQASPFVLFLWFLSDADTSTCSPYNPRRQKKSGDCDPTDTACLCRNEGTLAAVNGCLADQCPDQLADAQAIALQYVCPRRPVPSPIA